MQSVNFNNLFQKVFLGGLVFFSLVFIVFTSIKSVSSENCIWIEAEDAEEVTYPLEIANMDGASGGKGVVSTGSHGSSIGYASYTFDVPLESDYYFWGRCFWDQVCSNSFIIIMNSKSFRFGEDPIVSKWHWISGVVIHLKRGKNILNIWNNEEGSKIDKILLTTDPNKIPTGEDGAAELYFDFEDGEISNLLSINKDNWKVVRDENPVNSYLLFNNEGSEGLVLINPDDPVSNYIYRLCFKVIDNLHDSFSVYFNYKDDNNFYYVSLFNRCAILYQVCEGVRKVVMKKDSLSIFSNLEFNDVAVKRNGSSYLVKINGSDLFCFSDDGSDGNGLGFSVLGRGVCVDNISVVPIIKAEYTMNFHATGFLTTSVRSELSPIYLSILKEGRILYQILKGNWMHTSIYGRNANSKIDGFEALEGRCERNDSALIIFGDDFWEDYSLKFAAKANNEGDIGMFFNFQDSSNYYLFKWKKVCDVWKYVIIKKDNGIEKVISEKSAPKLRFGTAFWYKIEMRQKGGNFILYIDDVPVIYFYDNTFSRGKVGFFTTCTEGAEFDDIQVTPTKEMNIEKQKMFEYEFYVNGNISTSYCDWKSTCDSVVRSIDVNKEQIVKVVKPLFGKVFIENKKWFKDGVEISTFTSEIPKDIDAIYQFVSMNKSITNKYQILFTNGKVSLYKDHYEVVCAEYLKSKRSRINILYTDKGWKINIDNKKVLEYDEKARIDSVKIAIGYIGLGKGEIEWGQISIKDEILYK